MQKLKSEVIIRPFMNDQDDIEQLTHVLNRAYKQLADMGLMYVASYQKSDVTLARIKNGYCLVAIQDDSIVGTATYYPSGTKGGCPWYEKEGVGVIGQFGVLPELQSTGVGSALLESIEQKAFEDGAEELALDTAEGASHLRSYYAKRGYRFIEYTDWEVTNYRSVIMSKSLQ